MTYQAEYIRWKESAILSDAEQQELAAIAGNEEEIEDRFYRGLSFGTAGLRGVMGMGAGAKGCFKKHGGLEGLLYAERKLFAVCERHSLLGGSLACILAESLR